MGAVPSWSDSFREQGQVWGFAVVVNAVHIGAYWIGVRTITGASSIIGNQYSGCPKLDTNGSYTDGHDCSYQQQCRLGHS